MIRSIEPHEGLWVVYEGGMQVLAGDFRQIEDWLDLNENFKQPVSNTPPDDACFDSASEAARSVYPAHQGCH